VYKVECCLKGWGNHQRLLGVRKMWILISNIAGMGLSP